jgi:type I restriction-modification system DNA methylase subunit
LIAKARSGAFAYESTLEPTKRKRLGQFFTGLPLSRLLAAIALEVEANTVIDPMAGHGDLLDAAVERAARQCRRLECLEGVEIDPLTADVCRQRLENWHSLVASLHIRAGDAFSAAASREYLTEGYAVVITNPPYVRYQTLATQDGSVAQLSPDRIRAELGEVVRRRVATDEWPLWRTLIDNYSGLADLSVPAWILSAALVRPGGVLALVAPAT